MALDQPGKGGYSEGLQVHGMWRMAPNKQGGKGLDSDPAENVDRNAMQIIFPWWSILALVMEVFYCAWVWAKHEEIRCCNCGGYGHRASQCPLWKGDGR